MSARVLSGRAAWWSALGLLCAALVAPLGVVDLPPLLDYLNHLARLFLLAGGLRDPVLARMYAAHWAVIPNLAIDLIGPALIHAFGLYSAGKCLIAMALLLPVLGCVAYSRTVFRIRAYWPMASGLVAYNGLFLLGLLNFSIGLGAALLTAALCAASRDRPLALRALLIALCSSGLFFLHFYAVLFFAILLAAQELPVRSGRSAAALGVVGVSATIPAALLLALAPLREAGGGPVWPSPFAKLWEMAGPFMGYSLPETIVLASCVIMFLALCWERRQFRAAPGIGVAMIGLLVLFLLLPFYFRHTGFIDARVPVMLALLAFAGLLPVPRSGRERIVVVSLVVLALGVRIGSIGLVWRAHQADVDAVRASIAPVPAGSRVLVVRAGPNANPRYWQRVGAGRLVPGFSPTDYHLGTLLLIERHAFFPLLFAAPGEQPISVRSPYAALATPQSPPPEWSALTRERSTERFVSAPYLTDWPAHFDFVLLLDAGAVPHPDRLVTERLRLVNRSDMAALYRVRRPSPPAHQANADVERCATPAKVIMVLSASVSVVPAADAVCPATAAAAAPEP